MPRRGGRGGRGRGRGGRGRGGGYRRVPGICIHYNKPMKRCEKGDDCDYIHICRYVFQEDGCRNGGCRRNHAFSQQPSRILQHFKIDPDQEHQELVELLRDRVNAQFAPRNQGENAAEGNEDDEEHEYQEDDEGSYYGDDLGPDICFPDADDMEVQPGDDDEEEEEDTLSSVSSSTSQSRNQTRRGGGRRQWRERGRNRRASAASCMDGLSDTSEVHSNSSQEEKTEICTFHVKDHCKNGDKCPRLHKPSKLPLPYQWQVRRDSRWVFFDENLNKRIEEAFCDPAREKIDKVKVGRTSYTVEFDSMTMFQPKDSMNYQEIRRLCTLPTVFNQMKNMQRYCTQWVWYWEDQGTWQEYSKQNPPNEDSITDSDTLERAYHNYLHDGNAKQIYPFSSRNSVNFDSMIHKVAGQQNLRIRRRPKLYGAEMSDSGASSTSGASSSRDERPNQRMKDRSTNFNQGQTERPKGKSKTDSGNHKQSSRKHKEANLPPTANMDYPRDGRSQQRKEDRNMASDHNETQKGNGQIKSGSGNRNKTPDVRPKEPKPLMPKQTAKPKHAVNPKPVKSVIDNPNQNLPFADSIYRERVAEAVTAKPKKPASSKTSSKTKQTYSEHDEASFKPDVDDHSRSRKLETQPLQPTLSSRETETVKLIDIFARDPGETRQEETGHVFGTETTRGRNIQPERVEGAEFVNTSYLEDLKRYLESDQDLEVETTEGTPKSEPVLGTNITYPTTHGTPKPAPVPSTNVTYPKTQETSKSVPVLETNVTYPATHRIPKPAPVPSTNVTYPTMKVTPKPVSVPSKIVTHPNMQVTPTPVPVPVPSTNVTHSTMQGTPKPAPMPRENITIASTTQRTPKPVAVPRTNVTPTYQGAPKPVPVKSVTNLSSSNSASGQSILKPEPLAGLASRPPEQELAAGATSRLIVFEQPVFKTALVGDTLISGNQSSGADIPEQRSSARGASWKTETPMTLTTPKSERVPSATPGCSKNNASEICAEYIPDRCHARDCNKLHVKSVFQWQYREGSTWKNFTDETNTRIEKGFYNPGIAGITVTFRPKVERLVSFNSLTVSSDTMMGNDFIRRLSTLSSVRCEEDWWLKAFCMEWKWYWKDEYGNWIEYARKNTKNYQSNVNANDLEIAYQNYLKNRSAATSIFLFETSHKQKYQLNFQTMRQQNIHYKTQRDVLRRPGFVTKADRWKTARPRLDPLFGQSASPPTRDSSTVRKQQDAGSRQNVPDSWDMGKMSAENEHVLVPLDIAVHEDEYMKVADKFWNTMDDVEGNIVAIKRVQNMELWEDFSIKRDRMTKKNRGNPVLEKLLWHGTNERSCEAICRQNFDFRLSGSNVGTRYGQGSYFAREAKYSDSYSRADGQIRRMFLVRVLVGAFTAGKQEFKRPPPRNTDEPLGDLYDSCVNKVSDPSIYVIFEKAQTYPEYLLEYKRSSDRTSPRHASPVPRSSSVGNVNSSSVPYGSAFRGASARPSPSHAGSVRSFQPTSATSYVSPSSASRMSTSASSPSLQTADSSTGQSSNASSDKKSCIVQ